MSTRATVAEPHGDSWRGRHTHSDGYPTYRGRHLWAIVQRDGVEKARQVIIHDYFGWSQIDATQRAIDPSVTPDRNADYGTPAYEAFMYAPGGMYGDGRFTIVPGYGVAYVAASGQCSESDWYGPHEPWGLADHEWGYVLADDALWVFRYGNEPILVATCRWDASEPNWEVVENTAYEDVA